MDTLLKRGPSAMQQDADILDALVQLLGHLAVAESFQTMQAKHVGLLRRQVG